MGLAAEIFGGRAIVAELRQLTKVQAREIEQLRRDLAEARSDARTAYAIVEALSERLPRTVAHATLGVLGFAGPK